MTVRQFPQLGDLVATRAHDQGSAVILHGAVLVARRDEPPQTAATDLSNIVPFARQRRSDTPAAFPLPSITADDRPAPYTATLGFGRSAALLVGSLALHSALLAMFWHEPTPMASIGIEAMNVEIVLGATTRAGLAPTPGQEETMLAPSREERGEGEEVKEQSRATTMLPQEVQVAARETAPEVTQQETPPEAEAIEPVPPEQRPETTTAETPVSTQPVERPQRVEQPRPKVQAVRAPERKRIAAPTGKKPSQKKQTAATTAADPSQGIGIGRSDKSSNYKGIVRAHLVRYKQTPRSGSGRGTATVQFLLDGRGRVTSARLVRSSGIAAFDQEVVAMARRASPFPPPPDGKGHDFTVSVNFEVR
jgi:periplasmic protein TonB